MEKRLNYKYEIFPTRPQRAQIYRILRESKIQWNRAVTIRKKLKNVLRSGQFEYVINTCLSTEKNNNQGQRVKAIQKICSQYPEMEFETAAHCYDAKTLVGEALGDIPAGKLLDIKYLAEELKSRHKKEVAERKEAIAKSIDRKNAPKLTVFWQFIKSINKYAGWWVGIDPGAQTALTLGLQNARTSETRQAAIHYPFLEKSDKRLEKFQQNLARKQGPKRKRTETEITETISQFSRKRSIQKLSEGEKDKVIAKEKERLGKTMISQDASNSWRRLSRMVGGLQYRVANQRLDVLHKVSRALVEGCDVVGIGHWEPERQVSYRKKRKALLKQVKAGIEGAKEALDALEAEKSKQGPKGIKKIRRGGRDKSIATLRRMVEEKAKGLKLLFILISTRRGQQ